MDVFRCGILIDCQHKWSLAVDYFQRIRFLGKSMRPKDWECMVEQNGANENK